jgi:hypothetical protein
VKLRILGNSIRLRLARSELAAVAEHGEVADRIEFGDGGSLKYRIVTRPTEQPSASFTRGDICVTLPAERVADWARNDDDVSITGEQVLANGGSLSILVEKDFECLAPRPGEDPRDLFDNPSKA